MSEHHAGKIYKRYGGEVTYILILRARWRCVVTFTLWPPVHDTTVELNSKLQFEILQYLKFLFELRSQGKNN
jgi:hypothetical protein